MTKEIATRAVLIDALERGVHQAALARELGVPRKTVSRSCRRHKVRLPSFAASVPVRKVDRPGRVCACGEHGFIGLNRGMVAFCDPQDVPLLAPFTWHARRSHGVVYAFTNIDGRAVAMHRLVTDSSGQHTDHWDSDGLNNRRGNLRPCTAAQNLSKRRKLTPSRFPFKGVLLPRGKKSYVARIKVARRFMYLGSYSTPELAARAYDEAAKRFFDEFALTNADFGLLSAEDQP